MKDYILTIVSIFTVAYLLGSFIDASFIITDWQQSTRNNLGVSIGMATFLSALIITMTNDINKNK